MEREIRFCCDEKCEQGRYCPARAPDWCDGFVLGVCAVSLLAILLFVVFR